MTLFQRAKLLQPLFTAEEINRHFVAYCKRHQIITRKMCRIGYVKRFTSAVGECSEGAYQEKAELTNSSSAMLRGLVANKPIPKDENIIIMPARACLHPGMPFKCNAFTDLIPRTLMNNIFNDTSYLHNSRLAERCIIYHNQLFVSLFTTYLLIIRRCYAHVLSSLYGADVLHLIDFVPRNEGHFNELYKYMYKQLNDVEVSQTCMQVLFEHFNVSHNSKSSTSGKCQSTKETVSYEEICECMACLLCIIFSRQIPVSYMPILNAAFQDTPFSRYYNYNNNNNNNNKNLQNSEKAITGLNNNNNNYNMQTPNNMLISEPISFICPLMDMCNHSTNGENVAVMVPDPSSYSISEPVLILRSLRDINENEELTFNYEGNEKQLKFAYGMNPIYC